MIESEAPSVVTPSPTTPSSKPDYAPPQTTKPSTTAAPTTPDTEDTIEVEVGLSPGDIPPIGDCQGKMYISHKKNCAKYYLCNFGQLTEQTCPGGLHWNKDRCDWPENTKCKLQEQISVVFDLLVLSTTVDVFRLVRKLDTVISSILHID